MNDPAYWLQELQVRVGQFPEYYRGERLQRAQEQIKQLKNKVEQNAQD